MQKKSPLVFEIRKPGKLKMLQVDYFLCLQIQLEDIANSKTLSKSTEYSELSAAAHLLKSECAAFMESLRLASAIEAAGFSETMVAAFAAETARENDDREMALRLANPRERTAAEVHDRDLLAAFGNLQVDSTAVISKHLRPNPSGSLNVVSKHQDDSVASNSRRGHN